jgi:hypothetical protein
MVEVLPSFCWKGFPSEGASNGRQTLPTSAHTAIKSRGSP